MKDIEKLLDTWIPYKLAYEHVVGASIGIVLKGKLMYANGFGFADREKKVLASQQTSYRIASISKTFTALALLQLQEQGNLKLNWTPFV